MPQSLAKIYIHIVFSTKNRFPFLRTPDTRKEMHAYLGGTLNELDCPVLSVGGPADHTHILAILSKNIPVSEVIGKIKSSSSKWVKTKGAVLRKFAWQSGYGVFSVSQSDVERVRSYIQSQEEHHRQKTFQDEFRSLLNAYDVSYDERYVWD